VTRGLPSSLLTALQAASLTPIHLVEVYTGLGSPSVVRVTDWDHDIEFPTGSGTVYTSRRAENGIAFDGGEIGVDPGSEDGATEIRFGDGDRYWRGLVDSGMDLSRQMVKIMRVENSQLGSESNRMLNTFLVDFPEWPDYEMVLHLKSLLALLTQVELPIGMVTREEYPGIPAE